jgi:transcription termination factor Rho
MDDSSSIELCKYIQNNISKLCQAEINEVFKIIHKTNSSYTQNNNGVFVNLNWIDESNLQKIYDYVCFCLTSQTEINKYEAMKSIITDSMNKEKTDDPKTEETIDIISPLQNTRQSRISSSMRFYLLKKKYQKKCGSFDNRVNNTLTHEEYT